MLRKTGTAKSRTAKPKGSAPKSAGGRPPKYDWSSIRRESIRGDEGVTFKTLGHISGRLCCPNWLQGKLKSGVV